MKRLDQRIQRSKRSGKIALGGVLLVSVVIGSVLVQGLLLALEAGRGELVGRAVLGLALLVGLNGFSFILIRRQHRSLDEAREELLELASLSDSH